MIKLIVATRNDGKMKEIKDLLKDLPLEVKSLKQFDQMPTIVEDGNSFKENALIKAKIIATHMGCLVMGEDSGIAVDALDGRPGIYSARYAEDTHEDANTKLLRELSGVPQEQRTARYHSAIALYEGQKKIGLIEDICEGHIAMECRGENGFGYDPLFIPEGYDKTFGELDAFIKARISHRAKALSQFRDLLSLYLAA